MSWILKLTINNLSKSCGVTLPTKRRREIRLNEMKINRGVFCSKLSFQSKINTINNPFFILVQYFFLPRLSNIRNYVVYKLNKKKVKGEKKWQ